MILNDRWIVDNKHIIDPFNMAQVNPASYDLTWSGKAKYPRREAGLIHTWDKRERERVWGDEIDEEMIEIRPGELVLLDTTEYLVFPDTITGFLMLKSSLGRCGLEHLHAGWFDPGFEGTATLELFNALPMSIALKRGQPIVQMVFARMEEPPDKSYQQTGRYVGQRGPTGAR